MCKFFSVISDGKGNVKHFMPEDVVKIMSEGNSENYDFNSHTSLSSFMGIKATDESKWNKYEYSPEEKKLTDIELHSGKDDSRQVLAMIVVTWRRLNPDQRVIVNVPA